MSITNIIVAVNIAVFLYINQLHGSTMANYYLAKYGMGPTNFMDPSVWVISAFLHANLIHISLNMFALFDIGNTLEREIGGRNFLIVYLLSMFSSAFVSFLFLSIFHFNMIIIGASGAIFGIWAARSVLMNEMKGFWTVVVLFHLAVFFFHMPIAWFAHFGGIFAGLICGYYLKTKKRSLFLYN